VALANRIVTFPVNPGFASLNLAQAVLLMGYEWFKLATANALPFSMPERSERASSHQMQAFFDNLVNELDKVEFLRPPEKRDVMLVNMRNIFTRMEPTKQDMHTLHGVVMAIAEGRKGPAKGGVLDGNEATRLRALLAEQSDGRTASDSGGTVRGLRVFCGVTRPMRNACCGRRSPPTAASHPTSSGRRRSDVIFRISCRSRSGLPSNSPIRPIRKRSCGIALRVMNGWKRGAIVSA
jgi:hypothetical protein